MRRGAGNQAETCAVRRRGELESLTECHVSRVSTRIGWMQGRTTTPYSRVWRGVLTPQTPILVETRRDGRLLPQAFVAPARRPEGVVVALAPWPVAKYAPSRPRGILLGTLSVVHTPFGHAEPKKLTHVAAQSIVHRPCSVPVASLKVTFF